MSGFRSGGFLSGMMDWIDKYYIITKQYVFGVAVGGLMALWLSTQLQEPIIFTGFAVLATIGPIVINLAYDLANQTTETGKEIYDFLNESPKTAVVYTGFTMTMVAAITAMIADSPPYVVGWILLLGMFGTVASVLMVFLLEVFEVVQPLLDIIIEILDLLVKLMDMWINLINEVFSVFESILGWF